jgi:uncharacterized lipoprotein YajG
MLKLTVTLLLMLLSSFAFGQETIQIGEVNNEIKLGPFAGSRDLAFGVQSILEELIQDKGYNLSYNAETKFKLIYYFLIFKKQMYRLLSTVKIQMNIKLLPVHPY